MHPVYRFDKSMETLNRAMKVIPAGIYGHLGPVEGAHIPIDAFPKYCSRADGAYFWDLDGNRFIDYMCAYGPIVLGYHDPDVEEAAARQRALADCTTAPSDIMVDFAELMVDTVASADWAFFAKNGNDVTSLAILTARAYTHRKKIVFFNGYYHGVSPWAQKLGYSGILEEDVANNLYVDWNDLEGLERVFQEYKGQIAGVIAQPYMHGNLADNQMPAPGFWQRVRKLCTDNSTVLIVDDVRAGFRLDLAGSDHYFGFEADLICFCKAIANGYNVSCLCGKDFLKTAVSGISYTGSYWMSAVPFAAGIACVQKLKRIDAPKLLNAKGQQLKAGLIATAAKHNFDLRITGAPSLFYLRLADDPSFMLHQRWIAECVKRGVFFTSHHNHFMNAAISDADIAETLEIVDEAFAAL